MDPAVHRSSHGHAAYLLAALVALLVATVPAASAAPVPLSGSLDVGHAGPEQATAIEGTQGGGLAGESVAAIGDFNGDGLPDTLIGEQKMAAFDGGSEAGGAYVVLGSPTGVAPRLGEAGSIRIEGPSASDHAGISVAGVGDVNRDGLADVVVGAPDAQQGNQGDPNAEETGAAFVVFGRRDGAPIKLGFGGFGGFRIDGVAGGDQAGFRVAGIGDLNGDERPEVLVGAPSEDAAGLKDSGAGYVVYGSAEETNVKLRSLVEDGRGWRMDGPQGGGAVGGEQTGRAGATLGRSINALADQNGDGLPEVLIGAPRAGSSEPGKSPGIGYVVYGRRDAGRVAVGDLGAGGYGITGSLSKKARGADEAGAREGDLIGAEMDPAGDVNGDGIADIIITGYLTDSDDRLNVGVGWVLYGKGDTLPVNLDDVHDGRGGLKVTGIDASDQTGFAASSAGDFNHDGLADVAMATRFAEPLARQDAGAAYVIWGSRDGVDLDLAEYGSRALRIEGARPGDALGNSVAPAGDVNGDGGADLLVGAPRSRTDRSGDALPGAAYIVYGAATAAEGAPTEPSAIDPGYIEELTSGCRPVSNVQALIIDDGYIDDLDRQRLRRQALDVYLERPRNFGTVFGLTGFADDGAAPVLNPFTVGQPSGLNPMKVLAKEIVGDDGFPGWEGLLRSGPIDNPSAGARIYLMDGVGFGEVARLKGLTAGAPPSYVIAVGGKYRKKDAKTMQAVAKQTGGRYYAVRGSAGIQKAVNAIESRLRCDVDVEQATAVLRDEGSDDVNVIGVDDDAYSVDLMVSWAGDWRDRYEIEDLEVLDGKTVVDSYDEDELADVYALDDIDDIYGDAPDAFGAPTADQGTAGAAQTAPKKVVGNRGRGFRNIRIRGVHKGMRIRVRVKAGKLRGRGGRVLTQINQSRRRR